MAGRDKKHAPVVELAQSPPEEPLVKRVQMTFTAAQLLAAFATPLQLLASPGVGKYYSIFLVLASYKFVTTPYTLGDNMNLDYPLPGPVAAGIFLAGLIDQSASQIYEGACGYDATPTANITNKPLTFTLDGTGPLTGGDGTLTITVYYSTETA